MVKDFIRKLVAIVAILFLFCLAFFPIGGVLFSNEIVETLFKNKAVWLMALLLVLGSTENETPTRKVEENTTVKSESHEIAKIEQYETQELEDDETLISPR